MKTPTHDELLAHAANRCPHWPGSIGATFVKDVTENGRDEARRWQFLVIDEKGAWAYIDFVATQIGYSENFLAEPIEEAVENFVTYKYEPEHRLASLIAQAERVENPIRLPLDERYRVPAPSA